MTQLDDLKSRFPHMSWSARQVIAVPGATDLDIEDDGLDVLVSVMDGHASVRCIVNGRFEFSDISVEEFPVFVAALLMRSFAAVSKSKTFAGDTFVVTAQERTWSAFG